MRSVIVTATDYNELKLIHTARRLFPRNPTNLSTKAKQDLARRFSTAYKLIREQYGSNLPSDLVELQKRLTHYQDQLDHWGLKDYQLLPSNLETSFSKLLYTFLHGLLILTLASIPSLLLNFPVGIAAHYWAEKEAKKDLKASRVKVAARDVLLSKKIVFSLVAVPVLWVSYAVVLLLVAKWQLKTIIVVFLSCPLFSYLGVMAVEAG
jgi:glycerol-3-phosphate O-acyltransferase / dihydroxyacetone phosphate acyltransferase